MTWYITIFSCGAHRPRPPKFWTCQQGVFTLGPPEDNVKEFAEDQEQILGKTMEPKRRTRQLSDEHKAKISAALIGNRREISDETREKMRLAKLGRQHSIGARFLRCCKA